MQLTRIQLQDKRRALGLRELEGLYARDSVEQVQWAELEWEAVALLTYFGQIKERKREEVREKARISGSSSSVSSATPSVEKITVERDHDRIAKELKSMGFQQEDVDVINYGDDDEDDDEAEKALKMAKVPVIDTLKGPFVC
ncbi:hypothetical protein EMPS_09514 [Entomortierella parvispora]|uniref:Uncharacterized protein n=1 Tax=Entomortierella parvispora TaxID=205924 RepID=A0A9P3M0N6_9FUNG|nr:hypothetical protein EMPS_09514 [Entomortierella parvispora]